MPWIGRLCGALAVPLALAPFTAGAQNRRLVLVAMPNASETAQPHVGLSDSRMARDHFITPTGPGRNGLTGMVQLGPNMHFAIGRLSVPNFATPRIEAAEIRRGNRGMTAMGLSFRF